MAKYNGIAKYAEGLGKVGPTTGVKPVLKNDNVIGPMYQTDPETGIQYEIDPKTFKRTGKTIAPQGTPADAKMEQPPKDTRWKPNATERNKKGELVPTKATRKYRKKNDMEPMKLANGLKMETVGKGLGAMSSIMNSQPGLMAKYGMKYKGKK